MERSHAVAVEMRPAETEAVASAVEMRPAETVEVSSEAETVEGPAKAVAVEVSSGSESVEAAPEAVKSVAPAAEAVTAVRVPHSERCSRGRAMSAVREVEACVSAAVPV